MAISISDVIQSQLKEFQKSLYTCLPARVTEVSNDSPLTINAKPLVLDFRRDGGVTPSPEIVGIPVLQQSGGGANITLPVSVGDTVLLVFGMRDISNWLDGDGKAKIANTYAMHSQTDAIAITGLFADNSEDRPTTPNDRIKISYGDSVVEMEKGNITINTTGNVTLGSGVVESAVLGESLKDYIDNHQHGYIDTNTTAINYGVTTKPASLFEPSPEEPLPSSPVTPTIPLTSTLLNESLLPDEVLSSKVKVE